MSFVRVAKVAIGEGQPLAVISGPCVIEEETVMRRTARALVEICGELGAPFVFKSSYSKDNRSSARAYRGPGLASGLAQLAAIRDELDVPILADVHAAGEVLPAAATLDALQVPAFLCRQTSLLEAAGRSGLPINLKKGQFMSPASMRGAVEKIRGASCAGGGGRGGGGEGRVLLTERGTCFGYDQLICDLTAVPALQSLGCPVVFDAGHAARERDAIPLLARCGVAIGADALYLECHPEPAAARCDGSRMLSLGEMERLLRDIVPLARRVRASGGGGSSDRAAGR